MTKQLEALKRDVQANVYKLTGAFEPGHVSEKQRQALSDAVDTFDVLIAALEHAQAMAKHMTQGRDANYESLLAARKRIAELEASPLAVKLPPHKYRECVNGLLEEAIAYAGTQQLRSRLSARLSNFVKPEHAAGGQVEGE